MLHIPFYFSDLRINQVYSCFKEIDGSCMKAQMEDQKFQGLYCVYFHSFNVLDEAMNKAKGHPLQKKANELLALASKGMLSGRHYIESAQTRINEDWNDAGDILMEGYKLYGYSMHAVNPIERVSLMTGFLEKIKVDPYASALTTIDGEARFDEVRIVLRKYSDQMNIINFGKESESDISGREAALKTFKCFEKMFAYVYGMSVAPGTDDIFKSLYSALVNIINKYNAKAKANRTRNETERNKENEDIDSNDPIDQDELMGDISDDIIDQDETPEEEIDSTMD